MLEPLTLGILFAGSFASTNLLIKRLIKCLSKFGMIDVPDNRRAHKTATPRGGGLAIALVLIIMGPLFEYFMSKSLYYSSKIIPPFFLISLISFLDDIKTMPALIRFIVHILCAGYAIYNFLYPSLLLHYGLPLSLVFVVTTIGFTAFINIYNFLDGIDGITAAESIHLSTNILILCFIKSDIIVHLNFIVSVSTLICACSLSFLMFNWPPAKIFLGDVGSIGLGFLIGLNLMLIAATNEHLLISAIIACLYYLADGGGTILIRIANREKVWQPHLKHFFQQAVKRGMSHKQVVNQIIFCNFILMILSISALYVPVFSLFLAIITVAITLIKFSK